MLLAPPRDPAEDTCSAGPQGRFARLPGGLLLLDLPCAAPAAGAALRLGGQPARLLRLRALGPANAPRLLGLLRDQPLPQGALSVELQGEATVAHALATEIPAPTLLRRPPAERRLLLRLLADTSGLLPHPAA